MSVAVCGHHGWTGHVAAYPIPTEPDPDPGFVPTLVAGSEYMVRVGGFPGRTDRGILWGARVEPKVRSREAGGNGVTVTVPATAQNMRIWGDPIAGAYDVAGRRLYSNRNTISRELIVGNNDNGKARWRFVVRGPAVQSGNTLTIEGVGFIGGLTSDRVVGAPTPFNSLGDRLGSFEDGTLTGWTQVGDIDAEVVGGGPDGAYHVRLRGAPTTLNYIEARGRLTSPAHPWGRVAIAGIGYVQLPDYPLDIEDYGLMSIVVTDADGTERWPAGKPDTQAAIATADMRRGSYTPNPIEAIGYLPSPPYTVDVWVRLYPTDETEWTYFDGISVIRREVTTTEDSVDLTHWPKRLFEHAQGGRDKQWNGHPAWGIGYSFGEPSGKEGTGVWWHPDGQSLNDALEAIDGIEVWDDPTGNRTIKAAKRRGAKRTDLQVNPWDLLGVIRWQDDPGAQRTAVRATSAASSVWGGADEGAIDTTRSDGQIIDVILSGPVGMTPEQLQAWATQQLGTLRLLQATATLFVSKALGLRISVGDTIRVAMIDGSAAHVDWFRVHGWTPDPDGQFIALDVGTDPEFGGL